MTAATILERQIEDHHVFPQASLNQRFPEVTSTLRDCILNRALIDKETMGRLGSAHYLAEIEKEVKRKGLESILRSHLLPAVPSSSFRQDRFEDFLKDREQLIAEQLKEVTG